MTDGVENECGAGPEVLIVDDEEDVRHAIQQALELAGIPGRAFARGDRVVERLRRDFPGIVVSDIRMPGMDGMALLGAAREVDAELPVILVTGHGDVPLAVEAMSKGANAFVEKPFSNTMLVSAVSRALELRRLTLENRAMRDEIEARDPLEARLVGRAPSMVAFRRRLRAVAESDVDVLILGETGTGKELAARAIHETSDRREGPFVAVNLAALPAGMEESELFGHDAGAFPGAMRARFGKFEAARGGTLLLDEIGAAAPELQAKLLRVIEERAVTRLGSNERIELDIRLIATSNRDLQAMTREHAFREDLLYRIAVVTLTLPPLRDRAEDAPRLFQHLASQSASRFQKPPPEASPELLMSLIAHDWPGNVRELRNSADRFVLGLGVNGEEMQESGGTLAELIERFERGVIAAALARHGGNLRLTYESLDVSRKTLYEKMQRHGLQRGDFTKDEG